MKRKQNQNAMLTSHKAKFRAKKKIAWNNT